MLRIAPLTMLAPPPSTLPRMSPSCPAWEHAAIASAASIPATGRAANFLREALRRQASFCEGRLIKTVGLFGDAHTMELVRKSMSGTNIENRAAALEALDTIGDKGLAKSVVSLLESEPGFVVIGEAFDGRLEPWEGVVVDA